MTSHVADRVIVITGAAGGFGAHVARTAAERGAKVVGADVDGPGLDRLVESIVATGGEAAARVTDVTDLEEMRALSAFTVETYGRIDVLVNNAGVMPLAFFADHPKAAAAWDRAIDINLKGTVHGICAVYDQMIAQGRGHVVNISSTYGNFATAGSGVYSATKMAVNGISESLRVEAQGKIKVSVVRPTGVPTTGLGGTVINNRAVIGMLGHHQASVMEHMTAFRKGELPPEATDPDDIRLWSLDPEHVAGAILYVIDQPWGVSISDITVRASGEEYML
jgi:NADP-dependent 3-hydroxy acid dehydrogenase YdfG